jgi:diguanylate cyclase (GGDEF)-like protein
MLKTFFAPALLLMNNLNYPFKLSLISALFAVPLSLTLLDTVVNQQKEMASIEEKHLGIQLINQFTKVIIDLEKLRDMTVLSRSKVRNIGETNFEQQQIKTLKRLNQFSELTEIKNNQLLFLTTRNLYDQLQAKQVSTGSEGDIVNNLYESSNHLVDEAYSLQSILINEFGLYSDTDLLSTQFVALLNREIQPIFETAGRARSFGSYFLTISNITSIGINLLEETIQKLFTHQKRLQQRIIVLSSTYPEIKANQAIESIHIISLDKLATAVEEHVMLDPDFTMTWQEFYQLTSNEITQLNQFRTSLGRFLEQHYLERKDALNQKNYTYLAGIGFLLLLFIYLFSAFIMTFRDSIRQLSIAATQVSEGQLERDINIATKDEIGNLAKLFDAMRKQLKTREEELIKITITDGLTRINNRKYFNDALVKNLALAKRTEEPTSLLLIDIDFFKKINDTYGHQAGDECLVAVAQCLKKSLFRSNDEVARYGGEEFAILLPATDTKGAKHLAERLCNTVRELAIVYKGQRIPMTISIGIATSNKLVLWDEDTLVSKADEALYIAKETGRDRWVCSHDK